MARVLAVAVTLLAICACSSSSPTCSAGRGGTGGGFGTTPTQVGLAGKPMNVEVEFFPTVNSCSPGPSASRADAAVASPDNESVTAVATAPMSANGGIRSTVTFTPVTAGPYHLSVRFEPDLGTVQKDVVVAVDKTDEAPVVVAFPTSPTPTCQQLEIDGDTLLCLDVSSGARLKTIRAAQVVSSVDALAFGSVPGRAWVETTARDALDLYDVNADGSLSRRASLSLGPVGNLPPLPRQILASGNRALVVDDEKFFEVTALEDGGISSSSEVPLSPGTWAHWEPDAGVLTLAVDQVCHFVPVPSGFANAGCVGGSYTVAGYDDDGIWWTDAVAGGFSTTMTLSVQALREGPTPVETSTLNLLPVDALSSNAGQEGARVSPVLHVGAGVMTLGTDPLYLPRLDGSAVTLVRYPQLDGTIHADSKRIWFQNDATLTWYPR